MSYIRYTVSLSIPDCCEDDDFGREPTPLDAVASFVAQASQDHLWCYRVEEEGGRGRVWLVDMSDETVTLLSTERDE